MSAKNIYNNISNVCYLNLSLGMSSDQVTQHPGRYFLERETNGGADCWHLFLTVKISLNGGLDQLRTLWDYDICRLWSRLIKCTIRYDFIGTRLSKQMSGTANTSELLTYFKHSA